VRHKVFEPVVIANGGGGEARAHMLNVSTSGALIHVGNAIARGDALRIRVKTCWVGARVMRADGQRIGVAFDQPLGAPLLTALLS
jgi:hypothetical protein